MEHTEYYQLPQWEETDRIMMDDFNDAMEKIDAGMGALASGAVKMASGSYVGNGTGGRANPVTITAEFKPYYVIISPNGGMTPGSTAAGSAVPTIPYFAIRGMTRGLNYLTNAYESLALQWGDNSLSWYYNSSDNNASTANLQLNSNGSVYFYIIIGM